MLQEHHDDNASIEITETGICTAESQESRHHSAPLTRRALEEAANGDAGPTEVYEDVQEIHQDPHLSIGAARAYIGKVRSRKVVPDAWPRDLMQQLLLLRETQRQEIGSDGPVPGYIQVRK